jgi:radical SAM protein with 4Fe4S-binding SPASM domain
MLEKVGALNASSSLQSEQLKSLENKESKLRAKWNSFRHDAFYNLYRFKYVNATWLNLAKPVDVSLELSSFCTNSCGYCYHGDPKTLPFTRGHMPLQLAGKILKESAELGVHSIKTNFRGESTMNPNFYAITRVAKEFASGATFIDRITNSNFNFRLEREDIFQGLCFQTKVKISFDSFIKDIFERQRKGSKYEATLANITKFYNYPGRKNEMVIQAVRTTLNANEDLEKEIKSRWPSAIVSIRDCVEGRVNKDLSETVTKKRDEENRQSCIQAHARLMIHHDGRVAVCCPDIKGKLIIGDAKTEHIGQIWKSKKAYEIRKSLKDKTAFKEDPCKTCSSFESYKGFTPGWKS